VSFIVLHLPCLHHTDQVTQTYKQVTAMSTDAPAAAPEGMVLCSCCGEAVPAVHAVRHVAFCERNNKKCATCGKTLRKVGLLTGFLLGFPPCSLQQFTSFLQMQTAEHLHCDQCSFATLLEPALAKHSLLFHRLRACTCGAMLLMGQFPSHKQVSSINSCRASSFLFFPSFFRSIVVVVTASLVPIE
jgi:hypothetical protein